MANKFPLILNTSANQIQEIASGDNLDLTGCKIVGLDGINSAGIVTFTKAHVGAATTWGEDLVVTGNARVTGILTVGTNSVTINGNDVNITGVTTASNFKTGTSNLHNVGIELAGINVLGADTPIGTGATIYDAGGAVFTGVVTATNYVGTINTPAQPNITSVGTLSSLDVSGNVSIGGTLTYEDVTNIDAVGLITARNGINVSGGTATFAAAIDANSDLDVDGHTNLDNVSVAGVTTFSDDVKFSGAAHNIIFDKSDNALEFQDAAKLKIGTDDDILLHHTSGQNYIEGALRIGKNDNVRITDAADNTIIGITADAAYLGWNGNTKLITTNTGAVITGICTATTFSGALSGNATTATTATEATNVTAVANNTTNTTYRVPFLTAATGTSQLQTDNADGMSYNPSTGTLTATTFVGTFTGTASGNTTISNNSDNRIITGGSGNTLNGESALTFDGNLFYLSATTGRIEIRASNGSTEVTTARFHNAASADNRVLISCEANQGGDPYLKFDSGGTNFIVGQRWIGTTNNLLVMGAGENAQSISGLFIKNNGYVGINKNNPGHALDVAGHAEINGTSDGVINFNTTSGNGAFARFRKGSSTDTVMYVGASKGMISGSNNVNDGGLNAQQGIMYLNSASGVFKFTTGAVTSSGIDIVPRGSNNSSDSNNSTSPFIRFYDYPTGNYADTTTADDNNWAIGADDSGESKFKIICGGGANSNLVTNVSDSGQTGTTAIAFTSVATGCKTEIRRIQTSETADLQGTSSVGGSTVNAHYDASPAVGTYMVHGFIDYRDNAPTNDPDQVRMRLQVGGTTITQASILDEDSNNMGRNHNDSFAAIIDVDGSTNVQVNVHTTDPGDGGGADYRYRINIYKIG